MKKIFIGILTVISIFTTKIYGAEIIPEYFLMERLIMLMDVAPTYISNDGKQELKAIQIDKEIMQLLGNSENPFYIIDSNNEKKLVRVGDYFFSPTRLSSIYTLNKDDFEFNFRDKSLPEQSIKTVTEKTEDTLNLSDIEEEQNKDIKEN
ncbi:hypothetical protein [uncultured Fusobacterium sp.]|uniref:hypothetical protein n=1 Tax=uncultured Fusobacterium sp. TaxID=159267 RepID=UPI0025EC44FB|nr:hypothetical protein [uncultured Fusobacterium sp.]